MLLCRLTLEIHNETRRETSDLKEVLREIERCIHLHEKLANLANQVQQEKIASQHKFLQQLALQTTPQAQERLMRSREIELLKIGMADEAINQEAHKNFREMGSRILKTDGLSESLLYKTKTVELYWSRLEEILSAQPGLGAKIRAALFGSTSLELEDSAGQPPSGKSPLESSSEV